VVYPRDIKNDSIVPPSEMVLQRPFLLKFVLVSVRALRASGAPWLVLRTSVMGRPRSRVRELRGRGAAMVPIDPVSTFAAG